MSYLTLSLLQVNTPHVLHHFFEKKGDFEINTPKIQEFCLQLCLDGQVVGQWGKFFFFFCILHN
jgi:hypothetical protein